jgi:hypothetical protein
MQVTWSFAPLVARRVLRGGAASPDRQN